MKDIIHIDSISTIHKAIGLASPAHPLISAISTKNLSKKLQIAKGRYSLGLYIISLKNIGSGAFQYGRKSYDYEDSSLIFTAPGQVFNSKKTRDSSYKMARAGIFFFILIL